MDWKSEKLCIQYLTQGWECKYHLVFAPKYRRQIIYGKLKVENRYFCFNNLLAKVKLSILKISALYKCIH